MSKTLGSYLIEVLEAQGVRHVFGIPGDYVLGFYEQLRRSPLKTINTCDEQGAGFAADAYARLRGLGRRATAANLPDLDFLRELGLLIPSGGALRPTLAAILLAGTPAAALVQAVCIRRAISTRCPCGPVSTASPTGSPPRKPTRGTAAAQLGSRKAALSACSAAFAASTDGCVRWHAA